MTTDEVVRAAFQAARQSDPDNESDGMLNIDEPDTLDMKLMAAALAVARREVLREAIGVCRERERFFLGRAAAVGKGPGDHAVRASRLGRVDEAHAIGEVLEARLASQSPATKPTPPVGDRLE